MKFIEVIILPIALIAVVAIVALGPEKLPTAMVEIAKFLKKFKSGVEDAKSTLDNELNISEMKAEAAKYKSQIEDAKSTLSLKDNFNLNSEVWRRVFVNEESGTLKTDTDHKRYAAQLILKHLDIDFSFSTKERENYKNSHKNRSQQGATNDNWYWLKIFTHYTIRKKERHKCPDSC